MDDHGEIDEPNSKDRRNENTERRPDWDWTSALPDTDHVRFLKSVNWSKTHVGPIKGWPAALRQATYQVIADTRPATLYWGSEYVPIYNAALAPLAGAAHPRLMGSAFKQSFPELWQGISHLFELAKTTGISADVLEAPMTVERSGYPEETFFTGNFTPIRDSEGQIVGFYNALFEVTKQKINDRRTAVLNMLAAPSDLTTESVSLHIMQCLETNEYDITMAIMYQLQGEDESGSIFRRCGQIGVPDGHPILVDNQDWTSLEGLIPLCRLARSRGTPITIPVDERFAEIAWRGPGGPSKSIAIITLSNGVKLLGFLIIGNNPRLVEEANAQFLQDLGRMVSGVLTSAISVTQSRRRQDQLERDLAISDMKIQHLVQHASVGMVHLLRNGTMVWANKQYFAIVGQDPVEGQNDYAFFDNVMAPDLPIAEGAWQQVINGEERVSAEIRLNRLYVPPVGEPVPATVLLLAFPYREDENVLSVMGCLTDVSRLKWAENWQARLAEDAQEAKRQQESFVDIVSHEMRNPLSAIVHSVDGIIAAIDDCTAQGNIPKHCEEALKESIAAARIIELCAKHQKHMIDSVLTLGRMESDLLSITPSRVHMGGLCQSIVTMFQKEILSHNISAAAIPHDSYDQLHVDELLADYPRVSQILINLLTNAIKYVKAAEPVRNIQVKYGGCISSPRSMFPVETHWAPIGDHAADATLSKEWGDGEQIYLTFSVKDSGIGIDSIQISQIFGRFNRGHFKTDIFYGGSGLGLFVSKQLAERHGGQIGVRSTVGEGSMFVFYIRVRRAPKIQLTAPTQQFSLPSPSKPTNAVTPLGSLEGDVSESKKLERCIHVLLVEDNLVNQKVLRTQLQRHSCVVQTANHGAEALQQLQEMNCHKDRMNDGTPIDVILMDTQMPVMGGLECTREIRRLQLERTICRHVPIIAVSANARQEQKDDALAAGSDAVMSKPFRTADLMVLINETLKRLET